MYWNLLEKNCGEIGSKRSDFAGRPVAVFLL